jgi:tetratricopeptide (TPR) repeat protein
MAKGKELDGRLAFTKGAAAQKGGDQSGAEALFIEAIAAYSEALEIYESASAAGASVETNASLDAVKKNIAAAYVNLSAALIKQDKAGDAVAIITEAESKGFSSPDFKKNIMAANHAIGLAAKKGGDMNAVIVSFKAAKDIDADNVEIGYEYAVALLNKGKSLGAGPDVKSILEEAEAEFTELLGKELDKNLELNSYCKLIECQLALNEDASAALEKASAFLLAQNLAFHTAHEVEADFIYSRTVEKFLVQNDAAKATNILAEVKAKVPGLETKIVSALEQHALHLHDKSVPISMKMLVTLTKVGGGIVNVDLFDKIKEDLVSISDGILGNAKAEGFGLRVLGDLEHCDAAAVDAIFHN